MSNINDLDFACFFPEIRRGEVVLVLETHTVVGPNSGIKKWPFLTEKAELIEFRYFQIFIRISGIVCSLFGLPNTFSRVRYKKT